MSEQLRLIAHKLEHLQRMRGYLDYSAKRMAQILPKLAQGRMQAKQPPRGTMT